MNEMYQWSYDKFQEYLDEATDETILNLEAGMNEIKTNNPFVFEVLESQWNNRLQLAKNRIQ